MFPERLTSGYRSFLAGRFAEQSQLYRALAEGQKPETMVIGCCDSRVTPELIFNASAGEIFVARNVANLVPPYESGGKYHGTSAALEFAIYGLRVRHIVVLGHERCGGISAFANNAAPLSPGDFIGKWMSLIAPAAAQVPPLDDPEEYRRELELAGIELSLSNLMTFPSVAALVRQGELRLHGAYFSLAEARLLVRDPETGKFAPLVPR